MAGDDPNQPHENLPPPGGGSAQEKRERELVSSLKSINNFEQQGAADEFSKRFDPKWWQDRRFKLDLVAVGVAALALVALFKQQNSMQGQLNEMETEQRAWIKVELVAPQDYSKNPVAIPDGLNFWPGIKDMASIPIKIAVRNVGNPIVVTWT
jgi:hypothetical protein